MSSKGMKRKSLAPQNQTPNKSPKLKPTSNASVQKPLKSPKFTPSKKAKAVPVQTPKKTPAKQKKLPTKVEADDDDEESEDVDISDLEMEDDDSVNEETDDSDADETNGTDKNQQVKKVEKPQTAKAKKGDQIDYASPFVVFVGHIDYKITDDQLRRHFMKAGEVTRVSMKSYKDKRSRGFGFVEMKNEAAYKKALKLNHTTLGDRQINVEVTEKKTKPEKKPKIRPQKKSGEEKKNPQKKPMNAAKAEKIKNKKAA